MVDDQRTVHFVSVQEGRDGSESFYVLPDGGTEEIQRELAIAGFEYSTDFLYGTGRQTDTSARVHWIRFEPNISVRPFPILGWEAHFHCYEGKYEEAIQALKEAGFVHRKLVELTLLQE